MQAPAQYSGAQCVAKSKSLREVVEAARVWNSQARRAQRLKLIAAVEGQRQDVQTQLYDTQAHLRVVTQRTSEQLQASRFFVSAPPPPATHESAAGYHQAPPTADAHFLSMLPQVYAQGHMSASSSDLADGDEDEGEGGPSLLLPKRGRDDMEHIRILASPAHAHGGRAAPPHPRCVSLLDLDEAEDNEEAEDNDPDALPPAASPSPLPRTGGPSASALRRDGSMSPLRRDGSMSPLRRGLRRRGHAEDGEDASQDTPPRVVRESQEAIIQILSLPSQAQRAETARQQTVAGITKVQSVLHMGHNKTRRDAPVVYRTADSIVTHPLLSLHAQRQSRHSYKGKGLDTPFGQPMQVPSLTALLSLSLVRFHSRLPYFLLSLSSLHASLYVC